LRAADVFEEGVVVRKKVRRSTKCPKKDIDNNHGGRNAGKEEGVYRRFSWGKKIRYKKSIAKGSLGSAREKKVEKKWGTKFTAGELKDEIHFWGITYLAVDAKVRSVL